MDQPSSSMTMSVRDSDTQKDRVKTEEGYLSQEARPPNETNPEDIFILTSSFQSCEEINFCC